MGFIDNRELKGVLIAITGYLLLSTAIYTLLGTYIIKWPFFLIPLAFAIFTVSRYFSSKVPFLNTGSYLGQAFHILLTSISYALFTKSLLFYVNDYVQRYVWGVLLLGFVILLYATKHHLRSVGGGNG